jgi:hypothetical protein
LNDQPDPKATGLRCPRCKGTAWHVNETRPAANRLVRVRTCKGCRLRVRTREVIEAATAPPKPRLKPQPDDAATTGNCC